MIVWPSSDFFCFSLIERSRPCKQRSHHLQSLDEACMCVHIRTSWNHCGRSASGSGGRGRGRCLMNRLPHPADNLPLIWQVYIIHHHRRRGKFGKSTSSRMYGMPHPPNASKIIAGDWRCWQMIFGGWWKIRRSVWELLFRWFDFR